MAKPVVFLRNVRIILQNLLAQRRESPREYQQSIFPDALIGETSEIFAFLNLRCHPESRSNGERDKLCRGIIICIVADPPDRKSQVGPLIGVSRVPPPRLFVEEGGGVGVIPVPHCIYAGG